MSLEDAPAVAGESIAAGFTIASTPVVLDSPRLAEVIKITEEIFGATPTVETMCDPDDPAETPFLHFSVQGRGENKELIQRHIQWGQRLRPLNLDLSLRLSITPID